MASIVMVALEKGRQKGQNQSCSQARLRWNERKPRGKSTKTRKKLVFSQSFNVRNSLLTSRLSHSPHVLLYPALAHTLLIPWNFFFLLKLLSGPMPKQPHSSKHILCVRVFVLERESSPSRTDQKPRWSSDSKVLVTLCALFYPWVWRW